jgi:hypothetical protein
MSETLTLLFAPEHQPLRRAHLAAAAGMRLPIDEIDDGAGFRVTVEDALQAYKFGAAVAAEHLKGPVIDAAAAATREGKADAGPHRRRAAGALRDDDDAGTRAPAARVRARPKGRKPANRRVRKRAAGRDR